MPRFRRLSDKSIKDIRERSTSCIPFDVIEMNYFAVDSSLHRFEFLIRVPQDDGDEWWRTIDALLDCGFKVNTRYLRRDGSTLYAWEIVALTPAGEQDSLPEVLGEIFGVSVPPAAPRPGPRTVGKSSKSKDAITQSASPGEEREPPVSSGSSSRVKYGQHVIDDEVITKIEEIPLPHGQNALVRAKHHPSNSTRGAFEPGNAPLPGRRR